MVDVSPETQLKRTMQRDDVTREHVEQILAAQATREARLAVADDVIDKTAHRMLSHRMLPACTHTIFAACVAVCLTGKTVMQTRSF